MRGASTLRPLWPLKIIRHEKKATALQLIENRGPAREERSPDDAAGRRVERVRPVLLKICE
jgi:hypothetical protein